MTAKPGVVIAKPGVVIVKPGVVIAKPGKSNTEHYCLVLGTHTGCTP